MSHLESLERKLREMSENGNGGFSEDTRDGSHEGANKNFETNPMISDLRFPRKFLRVIGYDGRCNDLVYCKPLNPNPSEDEEISVDTESSSAPEDPRQKCVVYFGGDMQDFPEIMEQHKEHRGYLTWNLEATATILQRQFPHHHIVVVRPSRIQIMTFSCFDNFVNSTSNTGVPDHVITHGSLQHLELLLKNLSDRIDKFSQQDTIHVKAMSSTPKDDGESEVSSTTVDEGSRPNGCEIMSETNVPRPNPHPHLDRSRISLIGFSKGCVVLNQLLYEFHYLKTLTPDDTSMNPFLSCIEDMYWLDGGHNGGKNTWITSRSLIETLCRQNIRIHVHMTPYQLTDERRPWIRKEERMFSDLLQRFNAPIRRFIHFENEPASLRQHFRLLTEFVHAEDIESNAEETMEHEEDGNESTQQDSSNYSSGILSV